MSQTNDCVPTSKIRKNKHATRPLQMSVSIEKQAFFYSWVQINKFRKKVVDLIVLLN